MATGPLFSLPYMYGKLFSSAYTGSMFGAGSHVFAVWGYVLANKDPDQLVELNPHLLAAVFGESKERVVAAIEYLSAPDPESRSDGEQGRRIVPAGQSMMYHVVNGKKYDEIRNIEQRRDQNRKAQQRVRDKKKDPLTSQQSSASVSMSHHESAESAPITRTIDTARDTTTTPQNGEPIRPIKKAAPRKRVAGSSDYNQFFEEAWQAYPKRPNNSKVDAYRQWQRRVGSGADPLKMIAGVKAYAEYCIREGREPEKIKQAATFFGPGRHWESDYGVVEFTPSTDEILRKAPREMREKIARIESISAEDDLEEQRTREFLEKRGRK